VAPETIVDMKFSGYFLQRLQSHLLHGLSKLSPENSPEVIERIKTGKPALTPEEDLLHMLTVILVDADKCAREQDKVTYKTIEDLVKTYEANEN
jgi:hypothetical protein